MYIEPVQGEGFYLDHLGRIGIEEDNGTIIWLIVEGTSFLGTERTDRTEDITAIDSLRLYGAEGTEPWSGKRKQ